MQAYGALPSTAIVQSAVHGALAHVAGKSLRLSCGCRHSERMPRSPSKVPNVLHVGEAGIIIVRCPGTCVVIPASEEVRVPQRKVRPLTQREREQQVQFLSQIGAAGNVGAVEWAHVDVVGGIVLVFQEEVVV